MKQGQIGLMQNSEFRSLKTNLILSNSMMVRRLIYLSLQMISCHSQAPGMCIPQKILLENTNSAVLKLT